MSTSKPSYTLSPVYPNPRVCAQHLGKLIREARRVDGRPLEEIAPLAALTVPAWLGIEAGDVSYTWEQFLLIARAALRCDRLWIAHASWLYEGARRQ